MARLGDIIEQIRGVSYKPSDLNDNLNDSSVILLRANNIQNGEIVFDDVVYVSKSKVTKSQYLRRGDILVCTSSGSKELVGKAAFVNEDLPMVFGAFCKVVRPKITCCKYIGHFFQSNYYRNYISAASAGANINNLRNEHIADLHITLPTLDEQRRIAAVLDKVSDLIAKRRQQLDKLDLLIKSRFVEMFGTFPANEHNWSVGKIRDVIQEARYGSSRPAVEGGKYPYLRMNNITYGGELDLTHTKQINVPETELPKCIVKQGDVLFNRTNSKELVGKTCVYDRDEKMVLAGFIIRVRVNDGVVLPDFLSAFLNTDFSKRMLSEMCKTAIGQANINAQEMQNIDIYVPPLDLQKKYVIFRQRVNKSKTAVKENLKRLETLKKALMQQYFG